MALLPRVPPSDDSDQDSPRGHLHHDWNQRRHNISAGAETITKISARSMLSKSLMDETSMPQGKLSFVYGVSSLTRDFN